MKSALGERWSVAGADLGIRVTAPFVLTTRSETDLQFDALVHDFGSSKGMLIMERWDRAKAEAAGERGFGYSCMGASAYDRASTIEVLRDWGWSSSESPPAWL